MHPGIIFHCHFPGIVFRPAAAAAARARARAPQPRHHRRHRRLQGGKGVGLGALCAAAECAHERGGVVHRCQVLQRGGGGR